jgi:hypothetical protein
MTILLGRFKTMQRRMVHLSCALIALTASAANLQVSHKATASLRLWPRLPACDHMLTLQSYTVDAYMATKVTFDENPAWQEGLDKLAFEVAPRARGQARSKLPSKLQANKQPPPAAQQQPQPAQPQRKPELRPHASPAPRQDAEQPISTSIAASIALDDDHSSDEDYVISGDHTAAGPMSFRSSRRQPPRGAAQAQRKAAAATTAAGAGAAWLHWPADDDYVGLGVRKTLSGCSQLDNNARFADADFRVARKLEGGPDQLQELIEGSMREPNGVEAFRGDSRRAKDVPAAAAMRGHVQPSAATQQLLAGVRDQLVARLSCRQADWDPPVRCGILLLQCMLCYFQCKASLAARTHGGDRMNTWWRGCHAARLIGTRLSGVAYSCYNSCHVQCI